MLIRRCMALFLELREEVEFSLASLIEGGAGLERHNRWLALAPHIDGEVPLDTADCELLQAVSPTEWVCRSDLAEYPSASLTRLLATGLLIGDGESSAYHRERDEALRAAGWWSAAAMVHRAGRWQGLDSAKAMEEAGMTTASDIRNKLGAPPRECRERVSAAERVMLPRGRPDGFESLLARRASCRNFDAQRKLPGEMFARMLQRVFSAQAQVRVGPDTVFLKKTSPSSGGLHPTEAYLIVQNVEGVAPGLYHYHPVDHALEPLPPPELPLAEFARLALAGQHWFANAPVLVALAPRFARSFWKYRQHAKAYRAVVLDSGHLSQTLYLSATEMGLGAFVTSAINEVDIEQAFGMDPLEESPLAICGFGWRAERMETAEFDPAGEVWEQAPDGMQEAHR
jgi:putative peptide maturation dehydrogenase